VRSPLLDYRIAELAFRMPTEIKLPEAVPDGSKGKFVLKEMAARHLGRDYVYAPKEGFGIPVGRWLKEDAQGYLRDVFLGSESRVFEHLDRTVVRRFATEHLSGRGEHDAKLWNLLMLDAWFRQVHRPARSAAA
jgi:asparagine synthase (glutamine-hydrolysing)